MFRVIRINDNGSNQPADIIVLPGSYEGSGAARKSITESGEYFIINSFNYQDDGTKPISPDNSQGQTTEKTASQHEMDGSDKKSQQAAEIGQGSTEKENGSKAEGSGKTKTSAPKKSSSGPASSSKKK